MASEISRRKFLQTGAKAAVGLTIIPSTVLGQSFGSVAPSDKLNILGVGIGGRGAGVLKGMNTQNIIGLCDVDWKYSGHVFKDYPKAKAYYDYRKMFDELGKSADAVMVATADHTHAIIAAEAITMGKNVYCEKPLTHTVYESRLLTKLADKYKVATQMGNQGSSGEGVRKVCEWIWNGEIGEITKVEAFTDRPIWPQGLNRPDVVEKVPKTLNWDLFVGPAQFCEYNSIYTPWNWRGWWEFGTGALGDMACHILHPVFKGLKLGYPTKVQGSSTLLLTACAPNAQMVKFVFPARDNMPKVAMPEVEVIWYDGGLKPMRPEGMPANKDLNDDGGGVIFHGTKDTLICGCYGKDPWLLSGRVPSAPKVLREVKTSHEMDWVRACKEDASNRVETASPFSEAGPFNEIVVMGVLAIRLQGLNQVLDWDGPNMRFTNIDPNATIRTVIKDGFEIKDGHPTFDKKWTDPVNATAFAQELIKHTYRNGWKLPDMPK
ncbi:Gfo/Idh/MocA family oxidoreductase [Dysgonomonas sp. HDW5A]|uniref:Gfo/Idh/MocA family protein n=1 Tax=unclassified Dysgonomonas TaxID=2630389 RepID=UPI00140C6888|nr:MULTISPECIES: Gfo/Idh/MocA family oxidoreductase [unclassified Dysgonomonas]QIK54887.1 Gfo/Idh/MocA family oxidoreductase [Dysgonomonas sp. HDW5B]QIK60318.1 Gfo/Idh/MocA family oxidoreductase [Dysgonomonas sp. HDW5A]